MARQKTTGTKKRRSARKRATADPASRPSGRGTTKAYLAERAYEDLRRRIMTGEFRPGEHLKEEALVQSLEVSRSVVRQVLIRLATEGLLEDEPKKGKSVARFDEDKLAQLVPIRIALEKVAVQEAIANMSEQDEEELRTLAERLLEPNLDLNEQDALDVALHRKIWKMAQNDQLEDLLSRVVGPFHLMANAVFLSPHYRRGAIGISLQQLFYEHERSPAGHQLLVEAMCRRDVAGAMAAIEEHITYNWTTSPADFHREVGRLLKKYLHLQPDKS